MKPTNMEDELEFLMDSLAEDLDKVSGHLDKAMLKIRAGRANPSMLEGVMVEYYGNMTQLSQMANVNTPDARTLFIQPFDKSSIQDIEKAILTSNLGFNPMNNGDAVIINIPPLTEERRRELVKMAKVEGEDAKISVRSARKVSMDEVKRLEKDGLSEDRRKDVEKEVQTRIDTMVTQIDTKVSTKEVDIMKV